MNKIILLTLVAISFLGCQKEDDIINENRNQNFDYNFVYIIMHKAHPHDTIYKQEYSIVDGLVLAEKYTNYNNPEYNHISTFEYDDNGKILREIRDDKIFKQVVWNKNSAKVYNLNDDLIGEFNFNDQMTLLSYKRNGLKVLNYDSTGNIEAEATEAGTFVEYLDYDYSIINPLSRINSISILRLDYKPHFKNVFKTQKEYPYEGDDYSVALSFYDYSWILNSNGLIETVTNEKTALYMEKFEYQ